ncbi:MAG: PQQ-binding-like beta-propeller repeat protein [Planctomycetales bacterium]|nr:PQQ-binding-like beta-propeller repeat protein [Planctomycetales bacterium]
MGYTAGILIMTGCGRGPGKVTPVDEVSLSTSGVELREVEQQIDPTGDWAGWRGPTGNGIAAASNAPTNWSESNNVRWMADVPGRGHGSPIVVGKTILLATALDDQAKQLVVAYDRESGNQIWERTVHQGNFPERNEIHSKGTNANCTLVSDGSRAYIAFFNDGGVTATALDLSGEVVWQTKLGAFSSKFGYAPSPVLYKSLVIFAVDNWGGGYLVAVDSEKGKIAWRVSRPAKNSHSSPFIASVGGRDQLLISGCDLVCSYDPSSGEELWSVEETTETTCGTMVASNDRVFVSGGYPGKQTLCLSANGEKLWENRTSVYEPSLLLVNDLLFAVADNGIAYCWSADDGSKLWDERLGGNFSASPTFCNGNIYVSDLSGKTYVFAASGAGYQEVSVNQLGNDCYASPAIVENEIYMRVGFGSDRQRQERLVAIGG